MGIFNVLKSAFKISLGSFNPHKEDGKQVFEQDCNTRSEAEEQREKIEAFFFGDEDKFKTKEEVKRLTNRRSVRQAISKISKKIEKKIIDGNRLLDFLTKFSIFVSWNIEEIGEVE